MSASGRGVVAALLLLAVALSVWGLWPRYVAWRTRREFTRAFRQDLAVFDSRHVDVWARQQDGRDSPR